MWQPGSRFEREKTRALKASGERWMIVVPVLRRVERWRGEDEEGQGWVTVTTSTGLRGGKPPLESPPAAKRDGNGNTIGLWGSPFTGVAGAVWSLRSSLILREAFRSLSAERHERKVDGGGETRRRWKILSSKPMEQGERGRDWETRVRKGRWKTREAEEALGGPTGAAWRTSRRPTSPLSPTPFSVTFLFLSVPSKRLKEAILFVLFFLFFFFFCVPWISPGSKVSSSNVLHVSNRVSSIHMGMKE